MCEFARTDHVLITVMNGGLAARLGVGYYDHMRTANIADLKNNLCRYLRQVRRGEEILIRDRNVPIAKIVPLPLAGEFDKELLALAAAGVGRLPEKKLDVKAFFAKKRVKGPRVSVERAVAAVVADREERDASILGR